MTQSSAELAKSPQQGTFPDYAQTLSFNFLDLLSPSFWIQKAMKLAGMPDPVDYILKPFTKPSTNTATLFRTSEMPTSLWPTKRRTAANP